MNKKDLKTGMHVKIRSGKIGLIVTGKIVFYNYYLFISSYYEDFTSRISSTHDIVAVYNSNNDYDLAPVSWDERNLSPHLIWERETIQIGDGIYDKKDVEEALKNVKTK